MHSCLYHYVQYSLLNNNMLSSLQSSGILWCFQDFFSASNSLWLNSSLSKREKPAALEFSLEFSFFINFQPMRVIARDFFTAPLRVLKRQIRALLWCTEVLENGLIFQLLHDNVPRNAIEIGCDVWTNEGKLCDISFSSFLKRKINIVHPLKILSDSHRCNMFDDTQEKYEKSLKNYVT